MAKKRVGENFLRNIVNLFSLGEKTAVKKGFDREKVAEIIEQGGELTPYELARCRVRYFNDGMALGSKLFIEEVFSQNRDLFGKHRKTGARTLRCSRQSELFSLRNLKLKAITASG